MRIAFGGFQHETNTFAPTKADFAAFEHGGGWPGLCQGPGIFDALVPTANIPGAGFLAAARRAGHEIVPTCWAAASPSAHVTRDAYERIAGAIVAGIQAAGAVDAVYLDLHGAMVAEHADDGEGEILARVRAVVGPEVPIVASLDLHANVTARMLEAADALTAFRTYPHVDMAETGARALRLIEARHALGRRFAVAARRIPFLIPICWQCTDDEPAQGLYAKLAAIEADTGIAGLSFTMGFPAADFPECSPVVWACGADAAAVEAAASALEAAVLAAESRFAGDLLSAEAAVRQAMAEAAQGLRPIVIADAQDNPGAGGNSDTTGLLRALVAAKVRNAALGLMVDPAAAAAAHAAGEGATIRLTLGGCSDVEGDAPFELDVVVEKLSDGRCQTTGPYYGAREMDLGPSACLRHDGVRVVVASHKAQLADQAMFRFVGIEPTTADVLVVKSTIHFRADFRQIAGRIITAVAPGPMFMLATDRVWKNLPDELRMLPGGPRFAEVAATTRR
ncbi:Microcystinase C [Rhodovastum atsumiense]|uniref:Microcystinase C n=1 Tax=Rhodovastum atsumiense TaxID=504468 RepID=A0A5M6IR52_9PROT|nr:M81 family metallopeptidase [Rhodovastum atsumiense]KAA5609945.1 M81 family metallopeptidase [Rhodovastum atsumiense]CAH2604567.1 Microcystinase C [Rhodovastum atsumiense]